MGHGDRNEQPNNGFFINTKNLIAVTLIALGIVVVASMGLTFATPGKSIEFLGLHLGTTDSYFIPPIAGALALVGGIILALVKPNKTG